MCILTRAHMFSLKTNCNKSLELTNKGLRAQICFHFTTTTILAAPARSSSSPPSPPPLTFHINPFLLKDNPTHLHITPRILKPLLRLKSAFLTFFIFLHLHILWPETT